ncbi:MAG: hypothetical protein ACREXR_10405 [Gammaproteobacteria bacterium]
MTERTGFGAKTGLSIAREVREEGPGYQADQLEFNGRRRGHIYHDRCRNGSIGTLVKSSLVALANDDLAECCAIRFRSYRVARSPDTAAGGGSRRHFHPRARVTARCARNHLLADGVPVTAEVSWREHRAVPAVTSAGRADDARW